MRQKIIGFYLQQYETRRCFGESICTHKASIAETEEDQSNLSKI